MSSRSFAHIISMRSCLVLAACFLRQTIATWGSDGLLSVLKMYAELLLNNDCQAAVIGVLLSEDRFMAAAFKFCVFYCRRAPSTATGYA